MPLVKIKFENWIIKNPIICLYKKIEDSPGGSDCKESTCN